MELTLSRQKKKVKVEDKTLNNWKLLCEHNDKTKIASDIGVGRGAIQDAFGGFAQPELITAINKWFKKNKK